MGPADGAKVGADELATVGPVDGAVVGAEVGANVGAMLGPVDGFAVDSVAASAMLPGRPSPKVGKLATLPTKACNVGSGVIPRSGKVAIAGSITGAEVGPSTGTSKRAEGGSRNVRAPVVAGTHPPQKSVTPLRT